MTVLNELSKIAYIGDSSQTLYPIPFEYINVDNIHVSVYTKQNEFVEEWTYSNQYIIEKSNVKVLSGFEIDSTKKLLIIRMVDAVQDNRYREGGDFPAKSTETSFDKLTMLIQQHQEVLDRCVKVEVLDNQTPEELLAEVYSKLDSATDVANDAISAAEQAQTAADNATSAVNSAEQTLIQTQQYVVEAKAEINSTKESATSIISTTTESAKSDIAKTVTDAKSEINTAIDDATINISNIVSDAEGSITNIAVTEANKAISNAAQEATDLVNAYVNNEIKPQINEAASNAAESAENASESAGLAAEDAADAEHWANDARIWATGEDAEVDEIAPGEEEHSSRGYADLAMAIANTPEDVPVDMSKLLALDVIKVPVVDLEGYVKNTDYITGSTAGVVRAGAYYGTTAFNGFLCCQARTLEQYNAHDNTTVIGKGTLENIKDDYVKRGVTENAIELTADEKANAKAWLGYADNSDIAQAIASISQFKISIVDALPTAGEAKTLYLVPKEGTDNDVYNEYLWLEQDSKFEFLGTTAVDLTDYVKNTDYAQGSVAGVVKASNTFACGCVNGYIQAANIPTVERYNNLGQYAFIGKGTLETALTQYSKTVPITESDYNALETKDTNTLYLIEEE